jgi:flagellar biosynthesis/type III secretory pathway M-ring protein FliF/YscJ
MSAHDSHAPVQQTKGIWALPLTAWIIVLILLVAFTRPIFHHGEEASSSHEKTEAHHTEAPESHH